MKFFLNSKYCPISKSNVNTVVTDMNNVESSIDSNSSIEEYNINNNYNRNDIVNNSSISDRENRNVDIRDNINNSVVTNNVVYSRSIGENCINISSFQSNECVNII